VVKKPSSGRLRWRSAAIGDAGVVLEDSLDSFGYLG